MDEAVAAAGGQWDSGAKAAYYDDMQCYLRNWTARCGGIDARFQCGEYASNGRRWARNCGALGRRIMMWNQSVCNSRIRRRAAEDGGTR